MGNRLTRCTAALALTCVSALAAAAPSWPRMTGDSPLHPDALPPERVAAIIEEARHVASLPHPDTSATHLPARWATLDRNTLAALIRMPQWTSIPQWGAYDGTRGILLQQAAAWDLLDFRRPSDVARLWRHLWPEMAQHPVKNDRHYPFGIGYSPDPTWAVRPRAMAAILGCLPHEAWELDGDVMVERNRRRWASGDQGPGVFRRCAEQRARFTEPDERYGPPHDPPGIVDEVIDLLKDRFYALIVQDGCSRPGPDGCLVLLDALLSLDRNDPRLPGLFRAVEPGFRLDSPIEVPVVVRSMDRDAPSLDDARLEVPEGEALRRMVYLRLKTRQLLHRPENWPAGELDRTLVQAVRAGLALEAARSGMSLYRHVRVSGIEYNAWLGDLVTPEVARRVADSQRAFGRELARTMPCMPVREQRNEWDPFTGTTDLWQAYRSELQRMGRRCE